MTLPVGQSQSSQVVGRYIGSQGPLPNTVAEFWRMIWEQQVSLLLMLTAESEGRRVKCHRYWPQAGETASRHGQLTVTCTGERKTSSATVRDFQLADDAVSDERRCFIFITNSAREKVFIQHWPPTGKILRSPGISHWSGKSQRNCGLPVMCYRSCDSHKMNIT